MSYSEVKRKKKLPSNTGIPWFTSLIRSFKTAHKAKTRKTKINFPLLPEKRRQEQSVCERKELI
jgi:hypothetical protein